MSLCYLNGDFLPLEQARVPVLDRGFILGDGVYEVVPVFGGRVFRVDQHLQRLDNSLAAVRIVNPLSRTQWAQLLDALVERNGGGDQSLYLQVTRGVAKRDHLMPEGISPTVFVMCNRLETGRYPREVFAVTRPDIRWQHCEIKAITLLANVLLRQEAADAGAYEAILIRDGWVTEGAASNVFAVIEGVVRTPPKGPHLLPGITRDLVLELLSGSDIPWAETEVSDTELAGAEEIWLTSSTREILAVVGLDGRPVGGGSAGPLWRRVVGLYEDFKQAQADPLRRAL